MAIDFFRVYSLPSSAPAHSRSFISIEWMIASHVGSATQGQVQRVVDGLLSPLRVREGVVQGTPSTQSILVEGIPYLIR